ncbi:MAG: helix-turn-helix domain-containing protein [Pseudonocardiaceae bacterium]
MSRHATETVCPTCHATSSRQPPAAPRHRLPPAIWLWSGPEAASALATRDLGAILRTYRRLNRLSQEKLATILGYDKTYVSMIETGRRVISDIATRRHIADALALPAHALGVTDTSDADFAAMIQFADSTIRLAEIARQSGRTVDAVNELWPLAARLEARAAEGHAERDTLVLLGQARLALGVSLGTVLPEERLVTAAESPPAECCSQAGSAMTPKAPCVRTALAAAEASRLPLALVGTDTDGEEVVWSPSDQSGNVDNAGQSMVGVWGYLHHG